jgi:trehalose 6-phosphate phosphatase
VLFRSWGAHLERKRCSLVLHTRGLPAEAARELEFECERLWRTYFEAEGLRLHRIQGGITLRATDRHKGTAVAELVAQSPPGALAVYLGDDATDRDAFRQVLGHGVAIQVGTTVGSSAAEFRLGSVDEVRGFLERWETATEEAERAGGPRASSDGGRLA